MKCNWIKLQKGLSKTNAAHLFQLDLVSLAHNHGTLTESS